MAIEVVSCGLSEAVGCRADLFVVLEQREDIRDSGSHVVEMM